jgi:hypothetical protein
MSEKKIESLGGSCQGEENEEHQYGPYFNQNWSVELIRKIREDGCFSPFAPAASRFALSTWGLKFLQDHGFFFNPWPPGHPRGAANHQTKPLVARANTPKPLNGTHRSVEEQRRIDESLAATRDSPE